MKFSEAFNIQRGRSDNWFDPILSIDSKLFIDPFLIFKSRKQEFIGSHDEIIKFFNLAFEIVAKSNGDKNNLQYKKARSILLFPEPREFCLGYTQQGTKGSGSGYGFFDGIFDAMWEMVKRGIKDIKHFEELGIFNEGIGADRISDIAANLLKQRFISYTQRICSQYKVPVNDIKIRNSSFDFNQERWMSEKVLLPIDRSTKLPIILVPEAFLDDLPEINPEDFFDYLVSFENQRLRTDFNYDISKRVDKKTIVAIARQHPDSVRRYTERKEKFTPPRPYDLQSDPKYFVKWYEDGKYYTSKNPLSIEDPKNQDEFIEIITKFNGKYKHFIELQKGYELLWNDDGIQRSESAVQRSYLGVIKGYCEMNDIDISKEANVGRGPVDFKFSRGYNQRTLLEVKLANNSHFWDGPGQQLPAYMEDNEVSVGFFMIIRFNKRDDDRITRIEKIIQNVNQENKFKIIYLIVNAEPRLSASKLRGIYA